MSQPINPGTKVSSLKVMTEALSEVAQVLAIADLGVAEVSKITCPAVAGAGQGDYFFLALQDGTTWAFWLDIDANGTAPTGAVFVSVAAGRRKKVSVVTGNTATQVRTAVKASIAANILAGIVVADSSTDAFTVTQSNLGVTADVSAHNTGDTGAGGFVAAVLTQGVNSNLNSKSFSLHDGANAAFYVWYNVNGQGVDPAPGGTGIAVALVGSETAAQVAAKTAAAVDAVAAFVAIQDNGTYVHISNAVDGTATDAAEIDSGFTFSTLQQGQADSYSPAISPESISNNPAAY